MEVGSRDPLTSGLGTAGLGAQNAPGQVQEVEGEEDGDEEQGDVRQAQAGTGTGSGTGYSTDDTFERTGGERPVMLAQLGGPGSRTGSGYVNGRWAGAGPEPGTTDVPTGPGLGPMYGPNGQWQGLGPSPQQQQADRDRAFGNLASQAYRITPPGYSMSQVQSGLNQLMQQGHSQSYLNTLAQYNPSRLSSMLEGVMGPRPSPTIGAPQQLPFGVRMFGPPNSDLGTGILWQGINNFGPPGAAGAPSFPAAPTLVPRGGRGIPGR